MNIVENLRGALRRFAGRSAPKRRTLPLPSIEFPAPEFEGGRLVRVAARFTRYESMEACFADRDRLITRLAVYADARAVAGDPEAFMRALAHHWATDPKYAGKLLGLYRAHGLDALDRTST